MDEHTKTLLDEARALSATLADVTITAQAQSQHWLQGLIFKLPKRQVFAEVKHYVSIETLTAMVAMPAMLPRLCDAVAAERQRADLLEGFLVEFREGLDVIARADLAGRPGLPQALVAMLAEDYAESVREVIADRVDLSPELAAKLAGDDDWDVRSAIADRADLPADLLTQLAADPDADVRKVVAGRAALPADLMAQLAADPDAGVRKIVAERTKG